MAIGDDATAAGMSVLTGNELANTLDTEDNRTRDYIAGGPTYWKPGITLPASKIGSGVIPLANGGTGANAAAGARANLSVYAKVEVFAKGETYDRSTIDAAFTSRDNAIAGRASQAGLDSVYLGLLSSDVYNRALGGTRRALWVQSDGVIGYAASTERYKKFVRPQDVTDEQIAQLLVVSYQLRAPLNTDGRREVGLIAERLVDAGLEWAVFFDEKGTAEGINYDMIGVALLPVVQRLLTRTADLDARLAALEARA